MFKAKTFLASKQCYSLASRDQPLAEKEKVLKEGLKKYTILTSYGQVVLLFVIMFHAHH